MSDHSWNERQLDPLPAEARPVRMLVNVGSSRRLRTSPRRFYAHVASKTSTEAAATSKTKFATESSSAHRPTPKVTHRPAIYDSNIQFLAYSHSIGTDLYNHILFNSYTHHEPRRQLAISLPSL